MTKIILLTLLLFFVDSKVLQAQEIKNAEIAPQQEATRRIDAFALVNAAYRGEFKEWGIPAYARLDRAYRGKQITASDLIEAASS